MAKKIQEKTLSVPAIKEGTVIDHITAGSALTIIHLLKIPELKSQVTLGLYLSSRSMGLKDLIKIENRFFSEKEAQEIAIFAPKATLNIIREYEIQKKIHAKLPEVVKKVLLCPNTRCITRHEPIESFFFVDQFKNKVRLLCKFCEKNFFRDEMKEINTIFKYRD